jgi:hypothetical protein
LVEGEDFLFLRLQLLAVVVSCESWENESVLIL